MKLTRLLDALPATVSVSDVAGIAGFSDSAVRAAISRGDLRSIRMGRRVRVLTESLLDLVRDEPALLAELRRRYVRSAEGASA